MFKKLRRLNARQRNEVRRAGADILDRIGLGAAALGVLQPVFDIGPDSGVLIALAAVIFIVLIVASLYIRSTMEDE